MNTFDWIKRAQEAEARAEELADKLRSDTDYLCDKVERTMARAEAAERNLAERRSQLDAAMSACLAERTRAEAAEARVQVLERDVDSLLEQQDAEVDLREERVNFELLKTSLYEILDLVEEMTPSVNDPFVVEIQRIIRRAVGGKNEK